MINIDPIRRLDDQSIIKYARKFTLPLPEPFIQANNIQPRDEMEIYRDRVNGKDALIIIPKKSIENNNHSEGTEDHREEDVVIQSDKVSG